MNRNVGTVSRLLGRSERKRITLSRLLDAPDYAGMFKLCTWRELLHEDLVPEHRADT